MGERDPIWRLRFMGRQAKRRLDRALHRDGERAGYHKGHAPWRRPFWTAETIETYGQAFAALNRNPQAVARGPNLVLALALGYKADQLAPFVLSLRASGYSGQIVFLSANLTPETEAFLSAQGVDLLPFDVEKYAPYHILNARYFATLDYLLERLLAGTLPRSILMADVRDVMFQSDPFALEQAELDVFYENESVPIGACKYNAYFLYRAFGDTLVEELESCSIACAGTTITTGKGALAYLIEMRNILMLVSDRAAGGIVDQATHNIIVHRGLVDGTRAHPNGDHVLTLHHVGQESVSIRNDGRVVSENGTVCAILHQYDRHPMLRDAIAARYANYDQTAPA